MAHDCNDQVQDVSTLHFLDLQKLNSSSELLRPEQAIMIIQSENKTGPKTSSSKSHIKLVSSNFCSSKKSVQFIMDKLIIETGYMTEKMKMIKITERKRPLVKLAKKEKISIMRIPGVHF